MKKLFEILVPTIYGDTLKPIKTKHHKNWDAYIRGLTGGLTILKPGKGQWVYEGGLFEERVIPVRIFCDQKNMDKIVKFTLSHYRQKAVMYYVLTEQCFIVSSTD